MKHFYIFTFNTFYSSILGTGRYDGDVDGDDTFGHYRTDVLDVKTNQWFRTSDEDEPIPISKVTSQGYIYLFKRN